ncbi:hypothetical protein B0H65DRAFT_549172 [Neurospora tetraspora]|uniref:C2H2-type domain-containing protein n=1 Tax=Neurospora tetraspora TaxID=94610 RepID=A0AAE0JGW3_9PEZI|nr:hypothetical protein B0H65DRAFT_549172 [Neurospora tetraspora]
MPANNKKTIAQAQASARAPVAAPAPAPIPAVKYVAGGPSFAEVAVSPPRRVATTAAAPRAAEQQLLTGFGFTGAPRALPTGPFRALRAQKKKPCPSRPLEDFFKPAPQLVAPQAAAAGLPPPPTPQFFCGVCGFVYKNEATLGRHRRKEQHQI